MIGYSYRWLKPDDYSAKTKHYWNNVIQFNDNYLAIWAGYSTKKAVFIPWHRAPTGRMVRRTRGSAGVENESMAPFGRTIEFIMHCDCSNQVALVTGATGSLGAVMARQLAEAGADIAVHYHSNASKAAALVEQITAIGRKACMVQADLSDLASVEAMRDHIQQYWATHRLLSPMPSLKFTLGNRCSAKIQRII